MTTKQIFELAVQMGIKADLRGRRRVNKYLKRIKDKYDKLDKDAKHEFDKEKFSNPYSDSRILVDNKKKEIKKVLAGIDIEGPELLLAKELGNIDLAIGHHPRGKALADLSSVMDMQVEILANYGVPINIAESVLKPRISEVSRSVSPANHNRAVDMARILKLDYACIHSPADNLAADFLVRLINGKKPEFVKDIIDILKQIPEYKTAIEHKAGPTLFVGDKDDYCGKVAITEFAGGTNPSKEIYEKMAQAGIGTIVGMHMHEEHRKEAEKYHMKVIVAGHIASDSLGINLFLDALEKKGITIVPCSGLIRVRRK